MDNPLLPDNDFSLDAPLNESSDDVVIKAEKKFGIVEGQLILCKNCKNIVTSPEHIITVNDQHRHTCLNPQGVVYQVGCFAHADGCLIEDVSTLENTWFSGFAWSISICSNCMMHLGWFYEKESKYFFGLILDRLVDSTN